jgi:DNA polymerase III subunit gamma/tau
MTEYKVLARKYRPQNFDDLVGQEVLVQTLRNAIDSNRIAQAFVLTGIRGIGKTTTARIIAKALNCIGADETLKSPTIAPCGVCTNCVQIRDDRHVDVLEMDAASRTGVDNMRELIESVSYAPAAARYKVYIIDEAHMLSNSAFNALLKTLEEPPAHVVFIFASTEIRKIPVTILSRCQRFDLQRLSTEQLSAHLQNICAKEQVQASDDAAELIAIAAEGSVRDALSLMDQAIAHSHSNDNMVHISAEVVRGLLGLVDRSILYEMLEHLFRGRCNEALELLASHHQQGADMATLLQDMMQAVHLVSRLLIDRHYHLNSTFSEHEKEKLHGLADVLNIPSTTKAWQILTASMQEIKNAPHPLSAMEMLFIRFSYAATMPDPTELLKILKGGAPTLAASSASVTGGAQGSGAVQALQPLPAPLPQVQHLSLVAHNVDIAQEKIEVIDFDQVIAWCDAAQEKLLSHALKTDMRLISCANNTLTFSRTALLDAANSALLKRLLQERTNHAWQIMYSDEVGQLTLKQQQQHAMESAIEAAKNAPIVSSLLEHFEDARIVSVATQH